MCHQLPMTVHGAGPASRLMMFLVRPADPIDMSACGVMTPERSIGDG
jgi:hypothetical protein